MYSVVDVLSVASLLLRVVAAFEGVIHRVAQAHTSSIIIWSRCEQAVVGTEMVGVGDCSLRTRGRECSY